MKVTNQEQWRDIVGYEGLYQVSDMGRVKKLVGTKCKKERIKSITNRTDGGYYIVTLYKNNKGKTKYIHRIVLEAFCGPCPNGQECRHLDGTKKHNTLLNLAWGTHSENAQDTIKHGNRFQPNCSGSNHGGSKLTEEDVLEIRRLLSTGLHQTKIAKQFKITQGLVSSIKLRKSWRHI